MLRISNTKRWKIAFPDDADPGDQWEQDYNYLEGKYPGLMDRMDEIQEAAQPGQRRNAVFTELPKEFPGAMQDPVVLRFIETTTETPYDNPDTPNNPDTEKQSDSQRKFDWIMEQMANGKDIYISTHLRHNGPFRKGKHEDFFRVGKKSIYMRSGRKWVDISYAQISVR